MLNVIARNAVTSAVAEGTDSLSDDGSADAGIFIGQLRDGGFLGIEFAGARAAGQTLRRHIEVLPDGPPAHARMPLDFAARSAHCARCVLFTGSCNSGPRSQIVAGQGFGFEAGVLFAGNLRHSLATCQIPMDMKP